MKKHPKDLGENLLINEIQPNTKDLFFFLDGISY